MKYPMDIVSEYINGSSTVKIAQKYNTNPSNIRGFLLANGVKMRSNKENSRRYSANESAFEVIDTEEKAYWLGFLYADGYVSSVNGKRVGLALAMIDKSHIEKFNDFLGSDYPIKTYKSSGYSSSEYCRLLIASEKMYDDLVGHGVFEHKSNILEYPKCVPIGLQRHFLRGYVDGDGCITNNGNSYALKIMGTETFLQGVIDFLTDAGAYRYGRTESRKPDCCAKSLNMFGETAYQAIKLLYDNQMVSLDRKMSKASDAMSYFSRLYQ